MSLKNFSGTYQLAEERLNLMVSRKDEFLVALPEAYSQCCCLAEAAGKVSAAKTYRDSRHRLLVTFFGPDFLSNCSESSLSTSAFLRQDSWEGFQTMLTSMQSAKSMTSLAGAAAVASHLPKTNQSSSYQSDPKKEDFKGTERK